MNSRVTWFFVFTFVLTIIGQGINLYVMDRLSAGTAGGIPIEDTPVWAWRPYGFYLTNVGPSLVGLLMTIYLYGLPGSAGSQCNWPLGRLDGLGRFSQSACSSHS